MDSMKSLLATVTKSASHLFNLSRSCVADMVIPLKENPDKLSFFVFSDSTSLVRLE